MGSSQEHLGVTTERQFPWWVGASTSSKYNLQRERVNHRDTIGLTWGITTVSCQGDPVVSRGTNLICLTTEITQGVIPGVTLGVGPGVTLGVTTSVTTGGKLLQWVGASIS